jgi:hypothetical protein
MISSLLQVRSSRACAPDRQIVRPTGKRYDNSDSN